MFQQSQMDMAIENSKQTFQEEMNDTKQETQQEEMMGLDDIEVDDRDIKLTSSDLKEFTVSLLNARMSSFIMNAFSDNNDTEINVKVHSNILEPIISYMVHHEGQKQELLPKPLQETDFKKVCQDPWDATFITGFNTQDLYDIILASNYLDIQCLLHLGCAQVAAMIKGKHLSEIKDILKTNQKESKIESK